MFPHCPKASEQHKERWFSLLQDEPWHLPPCTGDTAGGRTRKTECGRAEMFLQPMHLPFPQQLLVGHISSISDRVRTAFLPQVLPRDRSSPGADTAKCVWVESSSLSLYPQGRRSLIQLLYQCGRAMIISLHTKCTAACWLKTPRSLLQHFVLTVFLCFYEAYIDCRSKAISRSFYL